MTDTLARLENALADRYRLERELGQGGMATVYLAEDLKHGRKVAIKVLHPELSAVIGGDRFLAEIRVTANLQHAHILGLIDSGEATGLLYYVMPYVAGESLRNRLNRDKQLPVEEAVRLAREVAGALDYAHRHGVVHRDIKPENILLQEGSALVADFGIALAVQQAGGSRMTQTGMSLGTPAYMSPEQAMGERDIGARSDVYALGAMTYEMLTGEPPFTGPNSQAIVAKVLTESPQPVRPKRPTVSSAVENAVLTSLQKLPADRFGTAKEFGDALEGRGSYAPTAAMAATHFPRPPRFSRPAAIALIAAIATVATLAGWLLRGNSRGDVPPARFALVIPASQRVTPWAEPGLAISADGQLLLYNVDVDGVTRVYARRLSDPFGSPIPGSDGAVGPVLSPEGDWFISSNAAYGAWRKMPVQGGASIEITLPRGISAAAMRWNGKDGYVVTLTSGELTILRATGALDTIAAPDTARKEQSLEIMEVLPDGNLLVVATDLWPAGHLVIINARTRARTDVHGAPTSWASPSAGHLVWADPVGVLFASPFDGKRVTGPPRSLGAQAQTTRGGRPRVSAARNAGDLAYIPVQPASLARVGRDGRAQTLLANPRTYHNPRVSPDGRKVALDISDNERDVWLLDLGDTTLSRITFEASGHDAIFTPDGEHIVFAVARGNIIGAYIRRIDGAGSTDSVLTAGSQYTIHTITPDGRIGIGVKTTGVSTSGFGLVSVPLVGDRKASTVLESRYMEGYPALSPDGRWLAYASDESGRAEVYVRPWPGPGPKIVISQHGGIEPIWSRDGKELFYRGPSGGMPFVIVAAVETRSAFRVVSRTPLFDDADYETATPHANYDVMPDGSFIMVRLARASAFTYLQNWPALMQQQASGGTP